MREHVKILVSFQTVKQTEKMITKAWQKNIFNMKGLSSEDQASFSSQNIIISEFADRRG